jgi:hypothetical protein
MLGLTYHDALQAVLATRPGALDFVSVRTEHLLSDAPGHDSGPVLPDRFRVAVQGSFIALTAATAFDTGRARRLATLADEHVLEWVAERLDAPTAPIDDFLEHVVERVERLQDLLGAAVLVSNGAGFLGGPASMDTSLSFLSALAELSGCGILLDIDALCRDARSMEAPGSDRTGIPTVPMPFTVHETPDPPDLRALNLDAVRAIAVDSLLADGDAASRDPLQTPAGALLMHLVTGCRRVRGITVGFPPEGIRSIGTDGIVTGIARIRAALPGRAGVVAFPGVVAATQSPPPPRPRGYLPGQGRTAPMRLVHCTPEAETPPAANDVPPTS